MKMFITWLKRVLALSILALVVIAFLGLGPKWLGEIAIGSLVIQPAFSLGFLVILALSPILGRIFCECLCPLGTVQSIIASIVRPKKAIRRVCTRLPVSRNQLIVRWMIFIMFAMLFAVGYGALAYMITPYSIVGKSLVLFVPGLVVFGVVVISSFWGDGRIWCNWICPIGTLFSVFASKSILKNKIGKGCENCRKCFPLSSIKENVKGKGVNGDKFTRRTAFKGVAVLAAVHSVEKTTDGGLAPVSLPGVPKRPNNILPPGAISRSDFNLKCVGCGLCVKQCPMGVLRQSTELKTFGQPEMFFQNGYCRLSCNYKCANVCPTGALIPRTENRANLHMGHAIWKKDLCLRNAEGDKKEYCKACIRNCPVKALHLVEGSVVVDKATCIGCGACEHVCPVRPTPAVVVKGFDRQREVKPIDKSDLIAEMFSRLEKGDTCVLAKDGIIIARDNSRGVKPLLDFLDTGKLKGAIVVDKVIGKAAAAICILGGVSEIHTKVISDGAKELLKKYGIVVSAKKAVKEIENRNKTGACPMEDVVRGLDDCKVMVDKVVEKLKTME